MMEIRNGRLYIYNPSKPLLKNLDFKCLSAYVCPGCNNVLRAYIAGYVIEESLKEYMEKDSMKYAYGMGNSHGGQWISLQPNAHKDQCRWEVAGTIVRGMENSVDALLKIHSITVKDKERLVAAIEAGMMPGFKKVEDKIGADLPILLYNQEELLDAKGLSFDEKWARLEKLGEYIDSKLETLGKISESLSAFGGK